MTAFTRSTRAATVLYVRPVLDNQVMMQ